MSICTAATLFIVLLTLSIPCKVNCFEDGNLKDFILKELKQLRNEVEALKQDNNNCEERILRLERENNYLRNENDQLKKDISVINERLDSMNTMRDEIEDPESNHDEKNLGLNATLSYPPSKIRIRKSMKMLACYMGKIFYVLNTHLKY